MFIATFSRPLTQMKINIDNKNKKGVKNTVFTYNEPKFSQREDMLKSNGSMKRNNTCENGLTELNSIKYPSKYSRSNFQNSPTPKTKFSQFCKGDQKINSRRE